MNHTIVTLKKGEGRTIKAGGAWIFDNEIDTITGTFTNGDIVSVHDFDGYPMGKGYINQNSKIRVRMLTRDPEQEIDRSFLKQRLQAAWDYRKVIMPNDLNCCRIVFGDADFLPGLVIDKYNDLLVMEPLPLGIDRMKETLAELIIEVLEADHIAIRGIYERSDAKERQKEGLSRSKGILWMNGKIQVISQSDPSYESAIQEFNPITEIIENGVHYTVDVENGQKTGFFLDQKFNRKAMQALCTGLLNQEDNLGGKGTLKALDCFTHMGTFALNCGLGGATDVTGLDISEFAVEQATNNAILNHLEKQVHFRAANVLDELPRLNSIGESYDLVILDPPAFTKSKDATKNAIKGYRQINIQGLKLVRDGGYFATCSCSHFMTQDLFVQTISQAAKAAHKRLRQIEFRTQAADHPILWAADQSYYLKFLIFQVVDEK